jgi:iron complex transport system substrate-binding protein
MDITRRSFLGLLLAALLAACGQTIDRGPVFASPSALPSASAAAFPVTVVDFQSRSTVIAKRPERIVSIGPSNTEYLFALGAGDRVVGVDDFSDTPPDAAKKEKVGGVKVNVEKVVSLKPDLIVTVKFSDGTIERLATSGAPVLIIDPQRLTDVARTAVLLGTAVGANGQQLATDIDKRIETIRAKTASLPKPRVYHEVDASDPSKLYTVGPGSFIADIIDVAGGTNVAARSGSAYPQLSPEEIVRADPEVIVLADLDYGVSVESVMARQGWSGISAVRTKRVFGIKDSLVSRPGPRVADAADAYAKLLHPELR